MTVSGFDASYYASNCQDADRPALRYYTRLARSFFTPGRLLDFGCGTGFFLQRLSQHFEADGLEISVHGLSHSRRLLPEARLFRGVTELPRGVYTGITSLHVLEHIGDEDLACVLASWRGALCPGGKVLCVVPELNGKGHRLKGERWSAFGDSSHINLKDREAWKTFFAEHGFSVIRAGTDGLWDFPYRVDRPKVLDLLQHAPRTVAQFISGRLLLPEGEGESLILLLQAAP